MREIFEEVKKIGQMMVTVEGLGKFSIHFVKPENKSKEELGKVHDIAPGVKFKKGLDAKSIGSTEFDSEK